MDIVAHRPAGAFWATQTVRQLLPPSIESSAAESGPWEIATGDIRDFPSYGYRGAMLDVSRHFWSFLYR